MPAKRIKKYWLLLTAGICIALLTGCGHEKKEAATYGKISFGVEQSLPYVFDSEIDIFQYYYPDAKLNAVYLPEAQLVTHFLNDSFRLIVSYRDFTDKERNYLRSRKVVPYTTIVGMEGLTLIVHPESTDTLITTEQLKQLLTGEGDSIEPLRKKWKDIVFDSQGSANLRYIDSLVGGKKLSDRCFAKNSNEEAIDFVANNKNSLGIISFDAIADKEDPRPMSFRKKIRLVYVSKDGKEFFTPSQSTFATGDYPFTRKIYMHSSAHPGSLSMGFISFVSSEEGQMIIFKGGLLPARLPGREVEVTFENIKVQ